MGLEDFSHSVCHNQWFGDIFNWLASMWQCSDRTDTVQSLVELVIHPSGVKCVISCVLGISSLALGNGRQMNAG